MSELDLSAVPFQPYYRDEHCVIYNTDCRKVLPFLPKALRAGSFILTYTIEVKHGEVWKPTGVEGTLAECERRIVFYPEKVRIVEIRRRVVLIREKRL